MSTAEAPTTAQATGNSESNDDGRVDMSFTKEVRKATKDVHNLTDVLINAKFAFGNYLYICVIE